MPSAQTIFGISDKKKLVLNERLLQEVFGDRKLQNKKICVVSIAGTFRQGKSFLLNFVLRYLNLKYVRGLNARNWLNATNEPLSGFSWKCGSDRHTVGILIWPEIFLAQLPNGEEVAIVVLDTQGTFDNVTSMTDCGTIFAMSSLLSSTQIYNMKEGIKQYDLSHLKCFSGYGQLLLSNSNSHPFQKLQFLIRDWQYPHEYPYGDEGGKRYLDKQLNNHSVEAEDIKTLTEEIQTLYKPIKCFLLPHPGRSVAMSNTFQGELRDIDEDFKIWIEKFVPQILSPENIIIKEISGAKLTVSDWLRLVESYAKQFQSGDMPPLKAIHESTAEVYYMKQVDECVLYYDSQMNKIKHPSVKHMTDNALAAFHEKLKNYTLELFRESKQMGNSRQNKYYENQISQKIDEKYLMYIEVNRRKKETEERELIKKKLDKERETREKERTEMEGRISNMQQNIEAEKRKQCEMRENFENKLRNEQLIRQNQEQQMKNELNLVRAKMEKENIDLKRESERQMSKMKDELEKQKWQSVLKMNTLQEQLTQEKQLSAENMRTLKNELTKERQNMQYLLDQEKQQSAQNVKILSNALEKEKQQNAQNMQILKNELAKERQNLQNLLNQERQQSANNVKILQSELEKQRQQSALNMQNLREELGNLAKENKSLTKRLNSESERAEELDTQRRNLLMWTALMNANRNN